MKARPTVLVALAAAVTLTSDAAAGGVVTREGQIHQEVNEWKRRCCALRRGGPT